MAKTLDSEWKLSIPPIHLDVIPLGGFRASLDFNFKKYKISAFPGEEVVGQRRAEHLPLHCHVRYAGKQLRIDCETLTELDGREIPRDLRKYLIENKAELKRRVEKVFTTGAVA